MKLTIASSAFQSMMIQNEILFNHTHGWRSYTTQSLPIHAEVQLS